jgi:hypothetical protein
MVAGSGIVSLVEGTVAVLLRCTREDDQFRSGLIILCLWGHVTSEVAPRTDVLGGRPVCRSVPVVSDLQGRPDMMLGPFTVAPGVLATRLPHGRRSH